MTLSDITKIILDLNSSNEQLHRALDQFAKMCSAISNIEPDPTYTAWSDDTFLSQGVAINSRAAAYCIKDYQRSVAFIRGVYAALKVLRQRAGAQSRTKILYAGCGPFATLLLPLLHLFKPDELNVHLLDIHQQSLDSVSKLINTLGLSEYEIQLVQADACTYQTPDLFDLIIVETMQKALEQEPQLAVTANLAHQLETNGLFIPEAITVELCLAHLEDEKEAYEACGHIDKERLLREGKRHHISNLIRLSASSAKALIDQTQNQAIPELDLGTITIPSINRLNSYQPLLFTRITVFSEHTLDDYESSLSLPSHCVDLEPLEAKASYQGAYVMGSYPKIQFYARETDR